MLNVIGRLTRSFQLSTNTLGFAGLTLVRALGGLLIIKMMVSRLGPDAFGQLGQLMAVTAIASMFAGGGVTNALIPALASAETLESRQQRLTAAVKVYLAESAMASIILIFASGLLSRVLLGRDDLGWVFFLLAGSHWLIGGGNLMQAVLSVLQRTRSIVLMNVIGTAVGVILFGWLVRRYGFSGAACGIVLLPAMVGLAACLGVAILPAPWRRLNWTGPMADLTGLLSYSGVMLISASAVPTGQLVVREMMGARVGWTDVGYWQSVLKISDVYMQFIGTVMVYYALPRLSEKRTIDDLNLEFGKVCRPLLALMGAGLLIIYLARDLIIRVLFNEAFMPAQNYFLPQIIGDLLRMSASMYVYYALSRGARLIPIVFEFVQMAGLILFSYLLLPTFGGLAPAYSYTITCGILLAAMLVMRRAYARRWRLAFAVVVE
jgi:O-antigen/teichoic acid export membrane protein